MDKSSAKKPFYITTTIPYVNADPHIGFALEIVHADIFARYKKLTGHEVFFNTGTDEHGIKIFRKAAELKQDAQEYVDKSAAKYRELLPILGVSEDIHFVRTTDPKHKKAVQEFWRRCAAAGDIYKKNYKVKYCVGCELEKTDSELVSGLCPIHPSLPLEIIEEENYFFRFSKYGEKLKKLYQDRPDFVIPDFRFNEIKAFINRGLKDFSISRQKNKMPWGVAVPDDPEHVMYVWFDAFINYISTLGWPDDEASFQKWWIGAGGVLQFAGKDQIRQQAAMWQAMLMSAGIDVPSKQIVIHGFITSGGEKMSKSLGNVIDPLAIVKEYGTDALRYYLARHIHPFEDSDFTMEKFKEAYNANLANGLGNFASRVLKMVELVKSSKEPLGLDLEIVSGTSTFEKYRRYIEQYDLNKAVELVWEQISFGDGIIQEKKPFELLKTDTLAAARILVDLTQRLLRIAIMLEPFMPDTSLKIKTAILANKKPESLFPRK